MVGLLAKLDPQAVEVFLPAALRIFRAFHRTA